MLNVINHNIRQKQEQREHELLSIHAAFSDCSRGRNVEEEPCDVRPVFQRDRDRIIHSKAFRRLNGKTQVFLTPEGDHYRTRMTHTLEVSQIARTIAKALRLNEDLAEAIALGHDLGHTPFGHAGERALNRVCKGGFEHHAQSIRVVETLEKQGSGLNLTWEVKDGIFNHQIKGMPSTLEGKIVRLSDKIAYINHDIDDAIRGKILIEESLPKECLDVLGYGRTERLNKLIHDIILHSEDKIERNSLSTSQINMPQKAAVPKNDIIMSKDVENAMLELRRFLHGSVYTNPTAKGQEKKAERMIEQLFEYYISTMELPEEYLMMIREKNEPPHRVVCDYIAGMTDRYAVATYRELMVPAAWDVY